MMRPPLRVLRLHQPERAAGAEEGAGQVDRDHPVPLRRGQLVDRHRRRAGSGVVEQQVQPPERLSDALEQGVDLRRIADVGRNRECMGVVLAGQRRRLRQRLGPPSGQPHAISSLEQPKRHGASDPAAGAGDEGGGLHQSSPPAAAGLARW